MPPRKPKQSETAEPKAQEQAVSGDAGAAELQAIWDDATAKGYFGITNDPNPNEAYSLASGPDSPSAASNTPAAQAKKES